MRTPVSALILALLALGRADAAPLRLAGSDLAGKSVQEAVERFAARERIDLTVQLAGSLPGRLALKSGAADAALLLADPRQSLAEDAGGRTDAAADFQRVTVASLCAYVLVAADNPVDQVDFHQLVALFGARSELRRWGELGGTGVWANRSIAPVLWSTRLSPVSGMFTHMVLEGVPPRVGVGEADDREQLLTSFSDQPGLIALAPFSPPPGSGVKALPVARTPGFSAGAPTPEAIARNEYPLRLPVELVFPRARAAEIAPLLRFFASAEGAAALEQAMLVPAPETVRAQLVLGTTSP